MYVAFVYTLAPINQFLFAKEPNYLHVTITWSCNFSIYIGLVVSKAKSVKAVYILILLLQVRSQFAIYHRVADLELYTNYQDFTQTLVNFALGLSYNMGAILLSIVVMPKQNVKIIVANIISNSLGLIYKLDLKNNKKLRFIVGLTFPMLCISFVIIVYIM